MSSSYTRNTELRNVDSKDLYNLAVILDDNNYWQTLMEIIPKKINNQTFGTAAENLEKISSDTAYERKFNNDHIRLIERAIRLPGESRLYSQILFDEWSTSGRKNERPTLGVLLHLLIQSKLFRAADFVAELLNEPKPSRPHNGPAAELEFKIDVFKDIEETMNDTRFYPNTEDLIQNTNVDINKDYYTKYHNNVDNKLRLLNDSTKEPMMTAPKPPPRLLKSARLLKQQQEMLQQEHLNQSVQETANKTNIANTQPHSEIQQHNTHQINTQTNEIILESSSLTTNNIPNLSALMESTNTEITTTNSSAASENVLPNLSVLNNCLETISKSHENYIDSTLNSTPSLIYSKPNIVEDHGEQHHSDLDSIPVVVLSKPLNIERKQDYSDELQHNLPVISALNLNGEKDGAISQEQSNHLENATSVASNIFAHERSRTEESAYSNSDFNIPCLGENINYEENSNRHQLESIEEDYNGIEHEHTHDDEAELEDDEDSIPNLSFLENRSSNNESSLTSVTNTSGDNSFEQSVNDCSSTSTDNVPILSVLNQ